jgi:NAD(P)-dependent dehydrogenase (short-subunit alcohol dehydrogenase family)
MTQIADSVCIVTGIGSGIGRHLAIQAAQRGARRIIGTDINSDSLSETARLAAQHGRPVEAHCFDVGSADAIGQFVGQVLPTLSGERLILINNAGIALTCGRFQDTPEQEFDRLLNINLMAVVRLTRAFFPYLLQTGSGHVVNVSSVFGFAGVDGNSAYCTAKFAVRGFTETLRMELADCQVNVTSVHPGGIKTNIVRSSPPGGQFVTAQDHQNMIESFDRIAKTLPEEAARQILNAVEKNKTRLVIGSDGKMLDWMTRLLPVLYTRVITRQYRSAVSSPYDR